MARFARGKWFGVFGANGLVAAWAVWENPVKLKPASPAAEPLKNPRRVVAIQVLTWTHFELGSASIGLSVPQSFASLYVVIVRHGLTACGATANGAIHLIKNTKCRRNHQNVRQPGQPFFLGRGIFLAEESDGTIDLLESGFASHQPTVKLDNQIVAGCR